MVSHHHGIIDYAVPPLMILPEIVRVVQKQIPVFVDCGIESGSDVFKALALGADAVCVGRALMGPLQVNGAEGVQEKIASSDRRAGWYYGKNRSIGFITNRSFCYMESVISGNPFPHTKRPSYGNRAAFCVWKGAGGKQAVLYR